MLKKIFIIQTYLLFLLTHFLTGNIFAQQSQTFETTANIEYKIDGNGKTFVTETILIKNLTSEKYLETLTLNFANLNPESLNIYEDGNQLDILKENGNANEVLLKFKNITAGLDKVKSILITYEESEITRKAGNIWEIKIPQHQEGRDIYQNITTRVIVPKTLGDEAIVFPEADKLINDQEEHVYIFNHSEKILNGITMTFGKYQFYNYSLNYSLAGTKEKNHFSIPIPPDTALQKVYVNDIVPKPVNVTIDEDGNWMAEYSLNEGEKVDVKVSGSIKVFASPIRYLPPPSKEYLVENLISSTVWNPEDVKIKSIAGSLENAFEIYKYTSQVLKYNPSRALPDAQRLGALGALSRPEDALCTEYSDLFVSLARAKGIPAREIEGYAYTDNKEIMPLSLFSDVLHSWVEYWDENEKTWISADPTWASTNKNVEYFKHLDMRHIAFVIHGKDPKIPLPPGSYKAGDTPQKDVFVSFGSLDELKKYDKKLSYNFKLLNSSNPFKKTLVLNFENTSNESVYNLPVNYLSDNKLETLNLTLPPYGNYSKEYKIEYGAFGMNAPKKMTLSVEGEKLEIEPNSDFNLFRDLAAVSILLSFSAFFAFQKIRSLRH